MSEANKQMAKRWFDEVWNKGRREAIDEMLGADCVIHDGDTSIRGPQEFMQYFDRFQNAFSDIHFEFPEAIAEGDLVYLRWVVTHLHSGDGLGIPASGKRLRVTGMTLVRIVNGRFVEAWQNWDMMGMMEQIQGARQAAVYMAAG